MSSIFIFVKLWLWTNTTSRVSHSNDEFLIKKEKNRTWPRAWRRIVNNPSIIPFIRKETYINKTRASWIRKKKKKLNPSQRSAAEQLPATGEREARARRGGFEATLAPLHVTRSPLMFHIYSCKSVSPSPHRPTDRTLYILAWVISPSTAQNKKTLIDISQLCRSSSSRRQRDERVH